MLYRSLTGHNYTPAEASEEKRVEAGEDCGDMPKDDLALEIEEGRAEEVKDEQSAMKPVARAKAKPRKSEG
jgi:hypothetical protein